VIHFVPIPPCLLTMISSSLLCNSYSPSALLHFNSKNVNDTSKPSRWRCSFLREVNSEMLQLLVGHAVSTTPFTFVANRLVHKSPCCSTPCNSGNCVSEDCQLNQESLIFSAHPVNIRH